MARKKRYQRKYRSYAQILAQQTLGVMNESDIPPSFRNLDGHVAIDIEGLDAEILRLANTTALAEYTNQFIH